MLHCHGNVIILCMHTCHQSSHALPRVPDHQEVNSNAPSCNMPPCGPHCLSLHSIPEKKRLYSLASILFSVHTTTCCSHKWDPYCTLRSPAVQWSRPEFIIVAPVRQVSMLGAGVRAPGARTRRVRAPRAWCGLYTLVNRNNDVTSLYTCLSRKNYRNCSRH